MSWEFRTKTVMGNSKKDTTTVAFFQNVAAQDGQAECVSYTIASIRLMISGKAQNPLAIPRDVLRHALNLK